ncbi:MAG: VOC family protein [Thermoplasmatota archaeon]
MLKTAPSRKSSKAAPKSKTPKKDGARASARPTATSLPRRATVTARETGPKVEGQLAGRPMKSVTGQLIVEPAAQAIEWYGKVFGAKELDRKPMPDGRIMHSVLQIGDTIIMVSDPFKQGTAPKELNGAFLHIQDKTIDAMWSKAIASGASATMPLANQFWGDRYGQLRDPFGQMWSFGWPAKMTEVEKHKLMKQAMQMGAMPT